MHEQLLVLKCIATGSGREGILYRDRVRYGKLAHRNRVRKRGIEHRDRIRYGGMVA